MLHQVLQDVRYTLRAAKRDAAFYLVAVGSVALGVAAVTLVVAVIDAVDFKQLPYPDADGLVVIAESEENATAACRRCYVQGATARAWLEETRSLDRIALLALSGATLQVGDRPRRLLSSDVSETFFDVLGVAPALGRTFSADDYQSQTAVVVVSFAFWQRFLGGSPDAVGRTVTIVTADGMTERTVVGVMPQAFRFLDNEVWFPLRRVTPADQYLVMARLNDRTSIAQSESELRRLSNGSATGAPSAQSRGVYFILPIREWIRRAYPHVGSDRFALLGAALLLLLLSAANVATFNLLRAGRARVEIGIRLALGATPTRVGSMLLVDSILFVALSAIAALAVASLASDFVESALRLPEAGLTISFGARGTAIALLASGLGGLLSFVPAALISVRGSTTTSMRQRAGEGSRAGSALQRGIVIAEIAGCALLTAAGAAFVSELLSLREGRGPGVATDDLYLVSLQVPSDAEAETYTEYARVAAARIGSSGRISGVGIVGRPARAPSVRVFAGAEPLPSPGEGGPRVVLIGPSYLETVGISPLRGRGVAPENNASGSGVAMVNQSAGDLLWPDQDVLGQEVLVGDGLVERLRIVGVIPDTRVFNARLKEDVPPTIFRPFYQAPSAYPSLMVRARGPRHEVLGQLRSAVRSLTQRVPSPSAIASIDGAQAAELAEERLRTLSLVLFASMSLFLAAIGTFGTVAYTTALRTREIAIRMALGAAPARLTLALASDGLAMVGAGVAVGLMLTLALGGLATSFVAFSGSIEGPAVVAGVLLLGLVLLVAVVVPALRATQADVPSSLHT